MRSFDVQRLVCFSLAEFGKGTESFVPEEATLSYWAGRIDVAAARRRDTHRSGRDLQCDASGNAVAPMSKLSGSKVQRFRRNSPQFAAIRRTAHRHSTVWPACEMRN
ncbi:hypothetical protein [Burkholderia thailandensis]|uniref:hypothetical protein n=1 Tax=Burkholderia thailandensis TaxID=57975 RepID=UPI0012D2BC2C|nr:hypothetical protein [Burkholderia thailandensis]